MKNPFRTRTLLIVLFAAPPLLPAPCAANTPLPIAALSAAPTIDGDLGDWNHAETAVTVTPAVKDDAKNFTGKLTVKVRAGVHGDRIYIAAHWPDDAEDRDYRPWKWKGQKYNRDQDRDDMFAVRFDMGGDYYECMFSKKDYKVDLWQWSAGRSDQAGLAEDYTHIVSTNPVESAAEYEIPEGGMVYIRKIRDAGDSIYENTKPDVKKKQGPSLPGIEMLGKGSGSLVDVQAKGIWKDGFWNLEFSRKLDTGNNDDLSFKGTGQIKGAIAVFNRGASEHKSTSETLIFDFSKAY